MHCPNCGNESSLDQKFCRKCGFNLAPVGDLMRLAEPSAEAVKIDRAEREAQIVRHMFRWITWGMIVLGIGVLMVVANKSFDLGKTFKFLSSVVVLGGVALSAYGVISAIGRGGAASLKSAGDKNSEVKTTTTRELDEGGMPIPIPSVTERTTELIGNKAKPQSDGG